MNLKLLDQCGYIINVHVTVFNDANHKFMSSLWKLFTFDTRLFCELRSY